MTSLRCKSTVRDRETKSRQFINQACKPDPCWQYAVQFLKSVYCVLNLQSASILGVGVAHGYSLFLEVPINKEMFLVACTDILKCETFSNCLVW